MELTPLPDPHAQQTSDSLIQIVRRMVQSAGGWLPFDEFMRCALYEPGLGYYSGGAARFGAPGDFETAPGISPLFGACIANACGQWFEQVPAVLTEFGAGNGQLAAQVLNALARHGKTPKRYQIVEVSGSLRAEQRATLRSMAPGLADKVVWVDDLPQQLEGVVVANEVLDAMPVRLFELRGSQILERGLVRVRNGEALAWQSRAASTTFARQVRCALARAGWGGSSPDALDLSAWPDGYISELPEQGRAWIRTIGERLGNGVILALDYGFPAPEYYHPQRDTGTLACHYRHRVHYDPLLYPGLQDITAHVDFTALSEAANRAGLALIGYTSQANFLLNTGLLDALSQMPAEKSLAYARQSQAVQKLVSEAEMGELFKVIAFGHDQILPGPAFQRGDRSGALTPSC